jgi:AMMECR1 domain-containing protein
MSHLNLASYLISGIFDLPYDSLWKKEIHVPPHTFGVFVTIERNHQIHGCIGYWDPKYHTISREFAIKKMIEVGKSATFEDSRSLEFQSILFDPNALFTVSWMLEPIYPVDTNTGFIPKLSRSFNNQDMGLIVQTKKSRATYLPKVFENASWNKITSSLIRKARVSGSDNDEHFLAYFTEEVEFYFYESFGNQFCRPYVNFVSQFEEIPYLVEKSGKVEFQKEEWVRNLAVIEGLENSSCYLTKNKYKDYLQKTWDIFKQRPEQVRQAMTSLIEMIHDDQKKQVCSYFDVQLDNLEPEFERPQVLIAMLRNCKSDLEIKKKIEGMMKERDRTIFRLNWDCQLLFESVKIWKEMTKYTKQIDQQLYPLLETYNENTMTNELAVGFECLCSLIAFGSQIDSIQYLMKIIILLWRRWDPKRGLYRFLDESERIDITNHVLHGQELLNRK